MKKIFLLLASVAFIQSSFAAIEGSLDPESVVESWSNASTYPKVIDINFSDESWPSTWMRETGRDCPEWSDDLNGGYVNAILKVNANGGSEVKYPVVFHNCVFANKTSYNGYAGATAAFSRQYYLGEKVTGNAATNYNNWTVKGHTNYLEDNIQYDAKNKPIYGEAGFVQMCRNAAITVDGKQVSLHGWMQIDHIPYIERIQWSWSSTSWGRGIKCDIKIGDGEWKPLVWMGSEKQKQGWTCFSDQGYFMENIINAEDVSLRWRVWDGEDLDNPVQGNGQGGTVFTQAINPMAQMQAPRVHKIQIFGREISAEEAAYAAENPVSDPGELSDLSQFGYNEGGDNQPAPDDNAEVTVLVVDANGGADFTTVQAAIDAVPEGNRGIIYIRPGVYDENIYVGTKSAHNKFISLIGEDPATTILTSSVDRGASNSSNTYLDCAALNVFTDRFYAENLTIRNTAGRVGQAEALYTAGDAHLFRNCVISGCQDTYKAADGARGYFTDCLIEGTVDFIYDGGLEWFENCEIRCLQGGGYITAPATSAMPMTKVMYPELAVDNFYPGLFFNKCNVTAGTGVTNGSFSLGRPWKENSGSMFLNCTLGKHISAAGWTAWNGAEASASLWEYNNVDASGQLIPTSSRASFSRQALESEVEAYINPEFLFANFSKVPFDYNAILRSANAPTNFLVDGANVTWDASDAVAYILYKDGQFSRILDSEAFEKDDLEAAYTVKAISRYGVTSKAVEAVEATRMLAFPTAEGFGKYTSGGRGGKVVKVTSIADDGSAGTLRWAFEQHKGEPITIMFEVSGDITLNSELRISRDNWTLAGQTAPGEGIVITHNKVNLGGSSNFIVRNVRFRIGQKNVAGSIIAENALGAENCSNFIFDHCSFGWSVEENMNTADSHFLTVQYCIVHEGLYNAGHSKGARGYGCQWGGSPATYHHNLLAHNNSRSCRFNGARGEDQVVFLEYINNVNYNYGKDGGCYGGENTAPISSYNGLNSAHECNFIGNYYYPGPNSYKSSVVFVNSSYARSGATSWAPAKWFIDDNHAVGMSNYTSNNWLGVTAETYKKDSIKVDERIVPSRPYYKYSLAGPIGSYVPRHYMIERVESATEGYQTVLAKAGTINRDRVEARVISDATNGTATYGGKTLGKTKGIIDTEADAEGFFEYSNDYVVPTDSDSDGMPDAWEQQYALNPQAPDNNYVNADGYTALEVYINSLMGEAMDTNFNSAVEYVVAEAPIRYDRATAMLFLNSEAVGTTLTILTPDGRIVMEKTVDTTAQSIANLTPGFYILHISTPTPTSLKLLR